MGEVEFLLVEFAVRDPWTDGELLSIDAFLAAPMEGGLGGLADIPLAFSEMDGAVLDKYLGVTEAREATDTEGENDPPDDKSLPSLLEEVWED